MIVTEAYPYELAPAVAGWGLSVSEPVSGRIPYIMTREMCELACAIAQTCDAFNYVHLRRFDGVELTACRAFLNPAVGCL